MATGEVSSSSTLRSLPTRDELHFDVRSDAGDAGDAGRWVRVRGGDGRGGGVLCTNLGFVEPFAERVHGGGRGSGWPHQPHGGAGRGGGGVAGAEAEGGDWVECDDSRRHGDRSAPDSLPTLATTRHSTLATQLHSPLTTHYSLHTTNHGHSHCCQLSTPAAKLNNRPRNVYY